MLDAYLDYRPRARPRPQLLHHQLEWFLRTDANLTNACRPNSLHLIPHWYYMATFNKVSETRSVCFDSDGVGT